MKTIEVFDGDCLSRQCPPDSDGRVRARLYGIGENGTQVTVPISDDIFGRHILLLGGIGTGKTNAMFQIIRQLQHSLTKNDVMVVFDTKGDFYKEFYRPGDIVISNDNKATGENRVNYWNIFLEVSKGERMEESIAEISKTLFKEKIENSSQQFFPNAAKDIFTALLIHAARSGEIRSNHALRNLLDECDVSKIKSLLSKHFDLRAIMSYISEPNSAQTQGVISELQQMIREIFIGNFRKKGTLSMREIVKAKSGKIVFIEYDLGLGNMLTPIYRLLFDLAIKETLSRSKSDGNVWFIADEFRLLPHLQHMEDAVNFGRSLGVKFLVGFQNVKQINEAYGETMASSILSGFLTSIIFRVNDAPSREYARGLFGANRKKEVFTSAIQSRGIIEQLRDANVVEDWDITRLRIGESIIGLPGQPPFVFQFREYK